jgi:uncharacterized protein (DUF2267 family)
MDYETFEKKVSSRAGIPRDRAQVLIRATLETLGERLTRGEADDLASQLPKPAKEWLSTGPPEAERFGLDEFVRRVSERTRVPPEEARTAVRAVFAALRLAVTGGEFKDVMSQLPQEFSELVES